MSNITGVKQTIIRLGIQYGLLKQGHHLDDYLLDAVRDPSGSETVCYHGQQGSGKSNKALQTAKPIVLYTLTQELGRPPTESELWRSILDRLVFSPSDFVRKLEAVDKDDRLDVVIWDDIQLNYTSSTFKTDIEQYSAIDSMFAVIRTKVAVVLITIPNISRLPKNIKDNVTFEVFVGKNRLVQIRKIFRLPNIKDRLDSNVFKPIIDKPASFDLFAIPAWVWNMYETLRKKIANEALAALKGVTDMTDIEGYLTIPDTVRVARDHGRSWGAMSIQQMASRNMLRKQKINGELCIEEKSLLDLIEAEKYRPNKKQDT